MKLLPVAISAAAGLEVANDAWTQVAAAYSDLYDALHAAYVGKNYPARNAAKKANRLRLFYNKVENFPGRVSDSCVDFAGSGDPDAFVPPYYDSEDICHSINNFIASVKSFHDAFVCMDDVDLTTDNRWAPLKMTRTIQRQRDILFNRKFTQLQCNLPIAPTPPPCSDPCDGVNNCYTLIDGCATAPVQDTSLGLVPAAISYKISAEVQCDHSGTPLTEYSNIINYGGDVYNDGGDFMTVFDVTRLIGGQRMRLSVHRGASANPFGSYENFDCVDGEWNTYALEVSNSPFSSSAVDFKATIDGNIVMDGNYEMTGEGFADLEVYFSRPLTPAGPNKVRNFFYQTL